ncbi:MAG: lipoyl domain-containing protein [Thermosphaera sp.]
MPRFDPLMEEGRIVQWIKTEGEQIAKGEKIAIIEGEKTTFELEAPYEGKLVKILKKAGDLAKVGETIAILEE